MERDWVGNKRVRRWEREREREKERKDKTTKNVYFIFSMVALVTSEPLHHFFEVCQKRIFFKNLLFLLPTFSLKLSIVSIAPQRFFTIWLIGWVVVFWPYRFEHNQVKKIACQLHFNCLLWCGISIISKKNQVKYLNKLNARSHCQLMAFKLKSIIVGNQLPK